MTRFALRRTALLAPLAALAALPLGGGRADAQYFGRNKVQYERFDFRIMRAEHLDFYFYPAESLATADAARMGERWYSRLSEIFRHTFDRKAVVLYADHPDFQQTNVVGGTIEEGTGGITEGLRTRVVMPHTGSYWDTDHVLGHELVHVFQYNVAESGPGGLARLGVLPLWLVEGMAEYLSLGRYDPLTAMWLRDATIRNKLPTIKQLTTDPRFFPYRYGQALWAYIGGRYGDRAVIDVYRASLRMGWDQALVRILGVSSDSLSKDWIAAIKAHYTPLIEGRQRPREAGNLLLGINRRAGDYNLSPTVSPDGKYLAFFSRRGLFSIDLYVADAQTGRIIRRLAGPTSGSHIDAVSFISSSGDWSPDANQFAFIVFAEGNHEVAVLDARRGRIMRRIKLPGVGAVNNVAWSPDGRTLALSGMKGGISDIYTLDLAAGTLRQLTNDRYADVHPAWSPDGRTIAFASDRGSRTSFERLTFSRLQLATVDVGTGQVSVHSPFADAKHINPQFSPDGRHLFFIADQDGFSDIYRMSLAGGAVSRVTRLATGVSGITHTSPAMTVSRRTGGLFFSVFDEQGFAVYALPADRTVGQPVTPAVGQVAAAGLLPPGDTPGRAPVTSYLADPTTGLPTETSFPLLGYRARFALDAIGQPSLGVASGPFGTGIAGGVSAFFGDQLGDQMIGTAIQAQGTVQDIGAQAVYYNLKRRVNWGAGLSHIPYLTGFAQVRPSAEVPGLWEYNLVLQRLFFSEASLISQYPFSTTRRIEGSLSATRIGYSQEVQRMLVDPQTGAVVSPPQRSSLGAPDPIVFGQGSVALVGDWSNAAFTSPVAGGRYRLEAQPTFGQITFNTALVDYRRYHFRRPLTFAWRAIHYGRYGLDAENYSVIAPLYLGEEQLVRGYSYGSFDVSECADNGGNEQSCPVFERLVGSRMAIFNAEFRIPLIGTREFGLLNIPFLPVELSPFFDAGLMWTSDQDPSFRIRRGNESERNATCSVESRQIGICAERVPVFSTGLSARINVLGYLIFETYVAKPFQRPQKDWVWGFQLAPGW
ncbi:MAG: peptidase S9 [Gemmatimonadaceae bacterium]